MSSSFNSIRSTFARLRASPPHPATIQENSTPEYRGTYLSQPFNAGGKFPKSFDEFAKARIGQVGITEIPTRIKEKHKKIWGPILNMDGLTTPLSDSIEVAQGLYELVPALKAQAGGLQFKADIQHALIRLVELWRKFELILRRWAKIAIGAEADAADGLTRLEEVRFTPVLASFSAVFDGFGEPSLIEEIKEFVETSVKLYRQIDFWLKTQDDYYV